MEHKPFQIDIINEDNVSEKLIKTSDEGRIYVRIGKVEISIKQTDDGIGINIDAYDAETAVQDLGGLRIAFDEVEEPEQNSTEPVICHSTEKQVFSAMQGGTD